MEIAVAFLLPGLVLGALLTLAEFVEILLAIVGLILLSPLMGMEALGLYNSRRKEDEADYVGLTIMAEAGYDLSAVIQWWEAIDKREKDLFKQLKRQHGNQVM